MIVNHRNKLIMVFCRGAAKGCNRDLKIQSKVGKCPDCVPALDMNETLGDFLARMEKGDA